ncbi:hypothetical protein [Dysgonomonas sp. ZJ709]|uniref:hypothetical protein n=1 Tax=Dysgonomonas sp. ZJ709 TaxID=2709797 RepID=UPI0013EDAB1B|nr:hypothetical protein [Dysgonomonas sp. ZJ709]
MEKNKLRLILNTIYYLGALFLIIRVFLYQYIPYSFKIYCTIGVAIALMSIIVLEIIIHKKKKKNQSEKFRKMAIPAKMEMHQKVIEQRKIKTSILYKLNYYSYVIVYSSFFFYLFFLLMLTLFEVEIHEVLYYTFFVLLGMLIGYFISDKARTYLRKNHEQNKN